jgi:hypothetical protein
VSDILLITPPDKLFNQNRNILLIYPSEAAKNSVQNYLAQTELTVNVYIYDKQAAEEQHTDWLLSVARLAEFVYLDIDNCEPAVRDLCSYFVSFSNCYWLTQAENSVYNKLSANRIYDVDSLNVIIGDKIEL